MDSQPSAKRERKANFSDVEVRVLLDVYRQHQVRLNAKFSNVITHRLKTALWLEVATAVSACGHSTRLVSDVRKKWTDLNSAALKAWDEANRPKTGGRTPMVYRNGTQRAGGRHNTRQWFYLIINYFEIYVSMLHGKLAFVSTLSKKVTLI